MVIVNLEFILTPVFHFPLQSIPELSKDYLRDKRVLQNNKWLQRWKSSSFNSEISFAHSA